MFDCCSSRLEDLKLNPYRKLMQPSFLIENPTVAQTVRPRIRKLLENNTYQIREPITNAALFFFIYGPTVHQFYAEIKHS
jgi:hypothetical protein